MTRVNLRRYLDLVIGVLFSFLGWTQVFQAVLPQEEDWMPDRIQGPLGMIIVLVGILFLAEAAMGRDVEDG